jgi:tRNA(Ile)-lysidine synthase
MPDLTRRILTFIRHEHLIDPQESVLVGVSGGIDSTALLFMLYSLKDTIPFSLAVAHVNHMLRGRESERDEAFVRNTADQLALPFHAKRVNVQDLAKISGKSIQHAGRDVRYDYFRELAEGHGYGRIAIAHNQDDQVETFVLRVIKGAGVRGLSCIPVKRGPIVRPFLNTTRTEIERYVTEKNIGYVEDSSNIKEAYERNYVRHRILPVMGKLNPTAHLRIMSLLGDLTQLNERLDREATVFLEAYASSTPHGIVLPTKGLRGCDEETRFRVLSLVLGELAPGFIALREHIRLIEKVLSSSRPSSLAVLPFGITVRREYDKLVCTTAAAPPEVSETFPLQPGQNTIEPLGISIDVTLSSQPPSEFPTDRHTAYLDAGSISDLCVRTFRNGDRFVPLGMKNVVKLKDYFISRKIPRSARRNIPLLIIGDDIAWVIGERIDDRFKMTDRTREVVGVTVRKLPQNQVNS